MLKNKITITAFFITLLFAVPASAQAGRKAVATVGKEKISADEFKIRYELMPHLSPYQNPDSMKKEFLYSLIAEKLWAMEAREDGMDTIQIIKNMMKPLKKMYVRDALYGEEIDKKVKVTKDEIAQGIFRSKINLKLKVISSLDSSAINKLYVKLNRGKSFDSLYNLLPGSSTNNKTPVEVSFGKLKDEQVENILYGLEVGEFSKPIKTENGWFIFNLIDKQFLPFEPDKSNKIQMAVKQIIIERKARAIGTKYLEKLLGGITIEFNTMLFLPLSNKLYALMKGKESEGKKSRDEKIYLDEYDIQKIIAQFGPDSSNLPIAYFKNNPPTLKDFLFDLSLNPFYVKNFGIEKFKDKLSARIKWYIRQELITREGYRKGIDQLPEVKKDLQYWEENMLAQMLRNRFVDSSKITDAQVKKYFQNRNKIFGPITEVNILEIMNKDLDIISLVLDELKKGVGFKKLAASYTQREWAKDKGGEFGYFPITMYGEIGKAASQMKVGEVYGPIKVPEGYSVIKLIDRKEVKNPELKNFSTEKEKIKNGLFNKRLKNYFDKYTAKYANKFGVKINGGIFKSIKVTEINMFTHKLMGFGGRIAAMPYTYPIYDWYKLWQNSKKLLP